VSRRRNADKEARWGDAIRKEGLLSALHPKWHLRTDDGKPPVIKLALESALDNPHRDLRTRLQTLQFIAPADREPLTDLARALVTDAFNGATGEARNEYVDVMRSRSATWFQGAMADRAAVREPAARRAHPDRQPGQHARRRHLRRPRMTPSGRRRSSPGPTPSAPGTSTSCATTRWPSSTSGRGGRSSAAETAGDIASGANEAAKSLATLLKWAPYAAAGIAVIGLTAAVVVTRR
jgi:hypothetical protein